MRTYIRYSSFLLFVVTLFSCKTTTVQPVEESGGSLLLLISKASTPAGTFRVVVFLEHAEFPDRKDSVNVSDAADFKQLHLKTIPPGTWQASVSIKDTAGVEWYNAQASVDIQEGEVSIADVALDASNGGLMLTIVWPTTVIKWETYANDPVLKQTPDGFDSNHLYLSDPKVLKVGSEYKMWYTSGTNYVYGDTQAIYLATSPDGLNWTKMGLVVPRGLPGSWNDKGSNSGTVLHENGIYKMWFEGHSSAQIHNGIGYATSSDGINWNVATERILVPDSQRPYISGPDVIKNGETYYLYYTVELNPPSSTLRAEIWLLTSTDGLNWTDRGVVLKGRANIAWGVYGIFNPSLLFVNGRFELYYSTQDQNGQYQYIGKALSNDGLHWIYASNQPELQPSDLLPWSASRVAHNCLLVENGKRKMWFSGLTSAPQWHIWYAEEQ